MEKTLWQKILEDWSKTYYTDTLWIFCTLVALTLGVIYFRKERIHLYFILYITVCLIFIFLWTFVRVIVVPPTIFIDTINTVFSIIEISFFYYYFNHIINSKKTKRVLNVLLVIFYFFSILFLLYYINSKFTIVQIRAFSFHLNIIEFFLLLLPCFAYFLELFTSETPQSDPLTQKPSFWITTGIFFYILVSLPFLIIGDKLFSNNIDIYFIMYSIHYISLSILFLCFAKAFSCKKTLTT